MLFSRRTIQNKSLKERPLPNNKLVYLSILDTRILHISFDSFTILYH